ncbi:exosortase N [Pontibacter sp. BT731]|uniref:exosortase N n=1 Tax=Pontibacter coccineus TaxID=3063328 RepID=UPI0026E2790B|nr:exosortase N [Pontibacter sp. BT731]MDO6390123.1 exosortase N [Pontibacter sp. BT731]
MKITASRADLLLILGVLGLYLAIGGFYLKDYLLWNGQWLLALLLVPLIAQGRPERSLSPWLLLIGAALVILACILQNSTFYFFGFLLTIWCGAQLLYGRISLYPLLLVLVASPIFQYVANIVSFPLRLQLTSWAVAALQAMGTEAEAAGNLILVNGEEFAVDPACAGLSMLSLTFILAVFLLARLQHSKQLVWPLWLLGALLGLMLLLNLVSNLLRILLLVWFKVLPDNPMHDVLGLLCLALYALVPFYLVAQFLHRRFGKAIPTKEVQPTVSLRGSLLLNYLMLLMLVGTGAGIKGENKSKAMAVTPQLAGFESQLMPNGVTQYSNQETLVYLKPVQAFYSTEHHPLICWEGSGYKFRRVQQRQVGSRTIYVGELEKGNEKLYTAWWMDNGQHQTIEQWDWRWRMLKGEAGFRLVNVTVAHQEELAQAAQVVMEQAAGKRYAKH